MALLPACPHCSTPVTTPGGGFDCGVHGPVPPLWRPTEPSYDDFGVHLRTSQGLPTYLPWPIGPGWRVSDFGAVGEPERPLGTVAACSGTTELDGPVDVIVVHEEPGTGLGGRCAGLRVSYPGPEVGEGQAAARVWIGHQAVSLWPLSVVPDPVESGDSEIDKAFGGEGRPSAWDAAAHNDRAVLVGEAGGRWLWLVLQPASALLLLRDEWHLQDLSQLGPELVDLTFGGPQPGW